MRNSESIILENTMDARLACLKDFLKNLVTLPLDLVVKLFKSFFRALAVCFAAVFVVITVGGSVTCREYFVEKTVIFARDVADWLLLPFLIVNAVFKLLLALLIHPSFYNS